MTTTTTTTLADNRTTFRRYHVIETHRTYTSSTTGHSSTKTTEYDLWIGDDSAVGKIGAECDNFTMRFEDFSTKTYARVEGVTFTDSM